MAVYFLTPVLKFLKSKYEIRELATRPGVTTFHTCNNLWPWERPEIGYPWERVTSMAIGVFFTASEFIMTVCCVGAGGWGWLLVFPWLG